MLKDPLLKQWMSAVALTSYRHLAQKSGVSLGVVKRLRLGQADHITPFNLQALAQCLQHSPLELLQVFGSLAWGNITLQQEYKRLQQQLEIQPQYLMQQFQQQTFQQLETLLTQYPTAYYIAQQAPHWSARNLTALFLPLTQLLQQWQIEPIGMIGEQVSFDPQLHESTEAIALSESVYVRFVGYQTPERILKRAKVSQIALRLPPLT